MNPLLLFCIGLFPAAQAELTKLHDWPAPLFWDPREETAKEAHRLSTAPSAALVFVAITPCRLMDTREGNGFGGAFGPPILAPGSTRTVPVRNGACGIPAAARAYSMNVTVVPPGFLGFVTLYPAGQALPNTSTVNSLQGFIVANSAIVPAAASGDVNVFASNSTHVILDINGYYAPMTGLGLAAGSVSAPSLSFAGDTGTGMSMPSPGVMSFSTGGVSRVSISSAGINAGPGRTGTPFAYANFDSTGNKLSGSENISCSKEPGSSTRYLCTLTENGAPVNASASSFVVTVTPNSFPADPLFGTQYDPAVPLAAFSSGAIRVVLVGGSGFGVALPFSVVVHKP